MSLPHDPLTILFRDRWLVAVDKPAGQLVHPAEVPAAEDIVTMKVLRDQLGQPVYAIHRIDRPTSGVLVFATDPAAAKTLSASFEAREVEKVYWAIVDGHPIQARWTCRQPLRKTAEAREREAETSFRVLAELGEGLAHVEAVPRTGRHHQIRRHLQFGGTPIVGDYRYAGIERSDELGARLGTGTRMLLQAKRLQVPHPMSGETITIEAPIDPCWPLRPTRA